MALPIFFNNAGVNLVDRDVPSFINQFLSTDAVITDSKYTQLQIMPWQISARDEQTGECLRQRRCKD
ncbi:hypothetical protein [Anabaena subtropica]|nr:hypothetical protein [Anabaena subtropica]